MMFQAQCPNSKENFLIKAENKVIAHLAFPISCFQVKETILTEEEDEALTDYGHEVAVGEIDRDHAVASVLKHRFQRLVVIDCNDNKIKMIEWKQTANI